MTLRDKTINGLVWSFIENFSNQGVTFIVGIILSRLLSPSEFGLIGMATIFIAISSTIINSGFSQALIRKQDCTALDYSTVFFFNIFVASILYFLIFILSKEISEFFEEPNLKMVIRVLCIGLIIESFSIIQKTILSKQIDFKTQTKISLVSSLISGIIGVILAYLGFGVWSLVFRIISGQIITSVMIWFLNSWRPIFHFSIISFKELFSFGSKLFISGLIETIYNNIYYFIIGKYFSAKELGFYTRADMFKSIPSQNISSVMSRVTYPVLSQLQDNLIKLKDNYQKILTSSMLISFTLMIILAAVSEPLIITLIGEQWRPSILYLQLLCFVGMLYPLQSLNLNILQVLGRSDLFLKLEIIKKIIAIPLIIIGIVWGIKLLLIGMLMHSLITYYINSIWSGKLINYSMKEQIKDIKSSFLLAVSIGIIIFLIGYFLPINYLSKLIIQLIIASLLFFVFCEYYKIKSYVFLKRVIFDKYNEYRNVK